MTVTEIQRETGWGHQGDNWVPPAPMQAHGHTADDIRQDGIWDPGDIKWSARQTPAAGWLRCDGALVSRSQYPRLFEAIGFAWSPTAGADPGGGNFYLPNIKGRTPVMLDPGDTAFDTLGEKGGAKTVTLTEAMIPGHAHSVSVTVNANNFMTGDHDRNHVHWVNSPGRDYTWWVTADHDHGCNAPWNAGGNIGLVPGGNQYNLNHWWGRTHGFGANHQHHMAHDHGNTGNPNTGHLHNANHGHTASGSAGNTGGGGAHDNLQPYAVLNCFVKT